MTRPPTAQMRAWTTWESEVWEGVGAGDVAWIVGRPEWLLEQDARGRSLVMCVLEYPVASRYVNDLISKAQGDHRWKQCLELEDGDGVRLPAYALRFATKRRLDHRDWVSPVFSADSIVSSGGAGLLAQLSRLARRAGTPYVWMLDQVIVSSRNAHLPANCWQAGLSEALVRAWIAQGVLRSHSLGLGTLNGPGSPDMHMVYNLLLPLYQSAIEDGRPVEWKHSLQHLLPLLDTFARAMSIPSIDLTTQARAQLVEEFGARLMHLHDCVDPDEGVLPDMLRTLNMGQVWGLAVRRVRGALSASGLQVSTDEAPAEGSAGRRL